jgi:hypothetical protein
MCSPRAFDYEKFIELGGLELSGYMDPLLALKCVEVLVYAIYLGAKQYPEYFAHLLPRYLGDKSGSVWTAAFNCLNQLPDEHVTNDLVESVRHVQLTNPNRPWIADALATLDKRLQKKGVEKGDILL